MWTFPRRFARIFAPTRALAGVAACVTLSLTFTACGSGAGGSGEPVLTKCDGATPILQPDGEDTGFAKCPDGSVFRDHPATCDTSVPACQGEENSLSCTSDADCTDKPGGKCGRYSHYGGEVTDGDCIYPCATDADCAAAEACFCNDIAPNFDEGEVAWSECLPARCWGPDDCPSQECGVEKNNRDCGPGAQLACRSAADECRTNDDCDEGRCRSQDEGPWECKSGC